jgi:hypothetical protein
MLLFMGTSFSMTKMTSGERAHSTNLRVVVSNYLTCRLRGHGGNHGLVVDRESTANGERMLDKRCLEVSKSSIKTKVTMSLEEEVQYPFRGEYIKRGVLASELGERVIRGQ